MEPKETVKNAQEARLRKEMESVTVEQLLKYISSNVVRGQYCVFDYVSDEVFLKMAELGFSMSKQVTVDNCKITLIEW